jgi:hypothetical protein
MTSAQRQSPPRGSTRLGTTIRALDQALRFEIPAVWARWHEHNKAHPSLHLTPAELDEVEEATGEWDHEFARVVNAILPFKRCVAHVGSDGWGGRGVSYADLQARAYVIIMTPEEIAARARTLGAAVVADLTGTAATPEEEPSGEWQRTTLTFRRFYVDYGATAIIDLRARRYDDHTVAFAFMYTDHADHATEIEAILDSVTFAEE